MNVFLVQEGERSEGRTVVSAHRLWHNATLRARIAAEKKDAIARWSITENEEGKIYRLTNLNRVDIIEVIPVRVEP